MTYPVNMFGPVKKPSQRAVSDYYWFVNRGYRWNGPPSGGLTRPEMVEQTPRSTLRLSDEEEAALYAEVAEVTTDDDRVWREAASISWSERS